MKRWLPFLLAALLLVACRSTNVTPVPNTPTPLLPTPSPLVTSSPLPLFTPSPPPSNTPTPTPLPPTPLPNTTQYDLRASLDYSTKPLTVAETIRYYNDTGETLNEMILVSKANWTEGVFQLEQLAWSDATSIKHWNLAANVLRFLLPEPPPPNT